jgi:hypothetical protein
MLQIKTAANIDQRITLVSDCFAVLRTSLAHAMPWRLYCSILTSSAKPRAAFHIIALLEMQRRVPWPRRSNGSIV